MAPWEKCRYRVGREALGRCAGRKNNYLSHGAIVCGERQSFLHREIQQSRGSSTTSDTPPPLPPPPPPHFSSCALIYGLLILPSSSSLNFLSLLRSLTFLQNSLPSANHLSRCRQADTWTTEATTGETHEEKGAHPGTEWLRWKFQPRVKHEARCGSLNFLIVKLQKKKGRRKEKKLSDNIFNEKKETKM